MKIYVIGNTPNKEAECGETSYTFYTNEREFLRELHGFLLDKEHRRSACVFRVLTVPNKWRYNCAAIMDFLDSNPDLWEAGEDGEPFDD